MMHNYIDFLEQLDLSENEAQLYLTLLKTGPAPIRAVAEIAGINRTSAYLNINQLIEHGLVIKIVKGAQTQVVATDPEISLRELIHKKFEAVKSIKDDFSIFLPELKRDFPQHGDISQADMQYYVGRGGVKKIYEDALKAQELRSYANLSAMEGIFPENLSLFSNAFQDNPDLQIFEIVEDSPASRTQTSISSQNEQYSFKFIPKDVTLFAADTLIYEGKVSIINVRPKITGVVFRNTDYFNNSRELFDFFWRMLPEVQK